jgi:type II secretory pathway predicted ATPase ExeA
MYKTYFGMNAEPFSKDIPPQELFISSQFKELSTRLEYLVKKRGTGLVTGEVGSGKTTGIRTLCNALNPGIYKPFYLPNTTGSILDLYNSLAELLGLIGSNSRAKLYIQIHQEIERLVESKKISPILIVDEAHLLRIEALEELRLLTNYHMDSQDHLTLILVGQAELRRKLGLNINEPLNQRIIMRYHLEGLTRKELPLYLKHCLNRVGITHPLFSEPAIEAIFQTSKGIPRKVNLLAQPSLMACATKKGQIVDADHVREAVTETS